MKAAPKIDLQGLYIEDTLMDDAFYGVVPFYADTPVPELIYPGDEFPEQSDVDELEELEPEIAGYIVGLPVAPGLFHPRFNLTDWDAREEGDMSDLSAYWFEGLTPEEIEELKRPQPQEPSELDRIGEQLVQRELESLELRSQNEVLGGQIIVRELEAADLKAQNEALGGQIVGLELRVLTLEIKPEGDAVNV